MICCQDNIWAVSSDLATIVSNVLREAVANFFHGLLSTSYCFVKCIAWQIIVITVNSTKFKVLFLTFSSAYCH